MKKKLLILIPDGVSLRNFAYTDFYRQAIRVFDVKYLNKTVFDLENELRLPEIKLKQNKPHFLSDIFKAIKIKIELEEFYRRFQDSVYLTYIFKDVRSKRFRQVVKFYLRRFLEKLVRLTNTGSRLQEIIHFFERKTLAYKEAKEILNREKPHFLFNTSQRSMAAVPVILAAQDLGIPTATFVYSWDNLPKATLLVRTDYYFVWSEYMKDELIKYYPGIEPEKIFVTGTPQFEPHFNRDNIIPKEEFFNKYGIPLDRKLVCFSGDDITTSPYDEYYLRDLADTINKINEQEDESWAILYRRCPVDFSGRWEKVKQQYPDIIYEVSPEWKNLGDAWNKVMPMKEDLSVLSSSVYYSEWVVNIGSSMVFDANCHQKPTAYINYNTDEVKPEKWDIEDIYKYIHFRSMPSKDAVFWINDKKKWEEMLRLSNDKKQKLVQEAGKWFDIINQPPQYAASMRIINAINGLINKK